MNDKNDVIVVMYICCLVGHFLSKRVNLKSLIIIVLALIMGVATTLFAQTNYYTESKIFEGLGYKYKCNVSSSKNVVLYNIENELTGKSPKYRTSGEIFVYPEGSGIKLCEYNHVTETKIRNIVNSSFSGITITQPQNSAQRKTFNITFYINSGTGKVDELEFDFVNFGPYAKVPVEVFRQIELDIKQNIQFEVTDYGKELDFIWTWRWCAPTNQ